MAFVFTNTSWPNPQDSVGEQVQSNSKTTFWHIRGPVQDLWIRLEDDIIEILRDNKLFEVNFFPYMRGSSPAKAKPTVILWCDDKKARRTAKTLVTKGLKLHREYRGVLAMEMKRLPGSESIETVAGGLDFVDSYVRYNAGELNILRNKEGNLLLMIRSHDGKQAFATLAGPISIGEELFLMTSAHGLPGASVNLPFLAKPPETSSSASLMTRQSSVDSGSSASIVGVDEIATTSRGSISSTSESRLSSPFSSASNASSNGLADVASHALTISASASLWSETGFRPRSNLWEYSTLAIPDGFEVVHLPCNNIEVLFGSDHLDYALINVSHLDLARPHNSLHPHPRWPAKHWSNHERRSLREVRIETAAHGTLFGTLLANQITSVNRETGQAQRIYLFTPAPSLSSDLDPTLTSMITKGDSGSWVYAEEAQAIVGHVVAANISTGAGYIVPSGEVYEDIERRFAQPALPATTEPSSAQEILPSQPQPNKSSNVDSGSQFAPLSPNLLSPVFSELMSEASASPNVAWTDPGSCPSWLAALNEELLNTSQRSKEKVHYHLNCPFRAHPGSRYQCLRSEKHFDGFRSIADLHHHLNKQHGMLYCPSCFNTGLDSSKAWRTHNSPHRCKVNRAFPIDMKSDWPGFSSCYPTFETLELWIAFIDGKATNEHEQRWRQIFDFIFGPQHAAEIPWQYFKPEDRPTQVQQAQSSLGNTLAQHPPVLSDMQAATLQAGPTDYSQTVLANGVPQPRPIDVTGSGTSSMPPPPSTYDPWQHNMSRDITSEHSIPSRKRPRTDSDSQSVESDGNFSAVFSETRSLATLPSSHAPSAVESSSDGGHYSSVFSQRGLPTVLPVRLTDAEPIWEKREGGKSIADLMSEQGFVALSGSQDFRDINLDSSAIGYTTRENWYIPRFQSLPLTTDEGVRPRPTSSQYSTSSQDDQSSVRAHHSSEEFPPSRVFRRDNS